MLIAGIVAFCIIVFVVAVIWPRASHHLERGGKKPLTLGERAGGKAPGKAGELAKKPFQNAKKAIGKSGSKGREGRGKLPF
jgi:hypothetical protein